MKHLKNRTFLLLLLSFVCINVNAWYLKYKYINDNTEVEVAGIVLEVTKNKDGYIIREERITDVKTVEIPSFYDGLPVTSIGDEVFNGCWCLVSVTLPSNLKKIGKYAFRGCSSLTSVTIPNSVTSIGKEAFRGCSGLTSVTIGSSVTSIGDEAFYGCGGLTSLTVANGNTVYDSRNNCNAIIETATGELIRGCETTVIPNSVTSIGDYAFNSCTGLTSVTIPNSVTSIGSFAFQNCEQLASVHINDLEAWCSISFSKGGVVEDFTSNPLYLARHLYMNNEEITDLVIPNSVSHINDFSFLNCLSFNSVSTPENLNYLGRRAFEYCENLKSVTIGNGPTTISHRAFGGCSQLSSVILPASIENLVDHVFEECNNLRSVTVQRERPPLLMLIQHHTDYYYEIWCNTFTHSTLAYGTLYVPVGTKERYRSDAGWGLFSTIVEGVPNGIERVEEGHADELGHYLLDGTKVEEPQKGLNIIRYSDGSTKKVMVK